MIGTPPSARGLSPISASPVEHAQRSSREWADVAETYVRRRMRQLGIPESEIGSSDWERGVAHRAFFPDEIHGGGNVPGRRLSVDSEVLNPRLNAEAIGPEASALWERTSLRNKIDAIIAHEYEEAAAGGDHADAVRRAPDTALPIREEARHLLRVIARGEGRQREG